METGSQRVASEESLYRRIYRKPWLKYANPDNTPTSRNFVPRDIDQGKLSVDVASLTSKELAIGDIKKYALAEVSVRDVESVGLFAIHDPCITETHGYENLAHALIEGFVDDDDITPALLARKARIIYS